MRWFSIAKSKGVANRDPHRGRPVLGTPQGRTDSVLPFEGYINARLLGQMVK